MHKALTKAFKLAGTRIAVRHFRKIGVHAAIPAAEALYAVTGVEIFNIVALARRAYKRAGAAAEACLGQAFPLRRIKFFHHNVAAEAIRCKILKRKLCENFFRFFFLRVYRITVRVAEQIGYCLLYTSDAADE